MKKLIIMMLCISIFACAFAGCSSSGADKTTTTVADDTITTDSAQITDADAINLIESYSNDELGLTADEKAACSFMVSNTGEEIDGNYYVKVIATIKTESGKTDDGDVTYSLENKGEYYISYDGSQVLSKNLETNEYTELEVKSVATTTSSSTDE